MADFNVISTLMLPAQPEERKADRDERPDVAGSVASERQLTGIINLDDGFQAASSPDRLSSLDPNRKSTRPKSIAIKPTVNVSLDGLAK